MKLNAKQHNKGGKVEVQHYRLLLHIRSPFSVQLLELKNLGRLGLDNLKKKNLKNFYIEKTYLLKLFI